MAAMSSSSGIGSHFLRLVRKSPKRRCCNRRGFFILHGETLEQRSLLAAVWTDKLDYRHCKTAYVSGFIYQLVEKIILQVIRSDGLPEGVGTNPWTIVDGGAGDLDGVRDGNFATTWYVNPEYALNQTLAVTALGLISGLVATATFTNANPSASLDQCANDQAPSPNTDGCSASASDWVNGYLGESKSVYLEGDSIAYRMAFGSLDLGAHAVTIEWDMTKSDTHAIDSLITFNRTGATADPCLGVAGCGAPTTFPIPADAQVTGADVTAVAGNFTLYGGTLTDVSAYSYADGAGFVGDKSARITVNFTASQVNRFCSGGTLRHELTGARAVRPAAFRGARSMRGGSVLNVRRYRKELHVAT